MAATRIPQQYNVKFADSKLGRARAASGTFTAALFLMPQMNTDGSSSGKATKLIVGAGLRSVGVRQSHMSEAVKSMGYGDIIEHADMGVASNTLTLSKQMMLDRRLGNIGIAAYGVANLTSPALECVLFNSAWAQVDAVSLELTPGVFDETNLTYVHCKGLHLVDNSVDFAVGAINNENVSFNVDKFEEHKDDRGLAMKLYKRFQTAFGEFYNEFAAQELQPYSFTN